MGKKKTKKSYRPRQVNLSPVKEVMSLIDSIPKSDLMSQLESVTFSVLSAMSYNEGSSSSRVYMHDYIGTWGILKGGIADIRKTKGKFYLLLDNPLFLSIKGKSRPSKSVVLSSISSESLSYNYISVGSHVWVPLSDATTFDDVTFHIIPGMSFYCMVKVSNYKGYTDKGYTFKVGFEDLHIISTSRTYSSKQESLDIHMRHNSGKSWKKVKGVIKTYIPKADLIGESLGVAGRSGFTPIGDRYETSRVVNLCRDWYKHHRSGELTEEFRMDFGNRFCALLAAYGLRYGSSAKLYGGIHLFTKVSQETKDIQKLISIARGSNNLDFIDTEAYQLLFDKYKRKFYSEKVIYLLSHSDFLEV